MRFWKAWLLSFAVLAAVMELWSLATPLDGAPDERAHAVKAAAVVRGEFVGTHLAGAVPAAMVVRVPGVFMKTDTAGCFLYHADIPAGCPSKPGPSRTVTGTTYVGHYPPLYYLLVGWPSYLATTRSWYLMRTCSALVVAAMLAVGFAAASRWSRSRLLVPALAVAATPTALFLGSVVNPSGLEIAAAISMWTTASILVVDHPKHPPPGLVAALGIATSVLVSVRGLSLLWPALCLLTLLPLAWGRLGLRELLRRRDVQASLGLMLLAAALAAVWVVGERALTEVAIGVPPKNEPTAALARQAIDRSVALLRESIGVFGWLDTPSGPLTQFVWIAVTGAIVLFAMGGAPRRALASVVSSIALTAVVPFVLTMATVRRLGPLAQGRYFLPLAVGVPIVAGAAGHLTASTEVVRGRLSRLALWLLVAGQLAAALWALHRYLVGQNGPLLTTGGVPGAWHPPLPGPVLGLLFVGAWLAVGWVLSSLVRHGAMSGREQGPTDPAGVSTPDESNGAEPLVDT